MVITRTPFRMSFFGGGTDLEEYFKENCGAVLSTTIDKYCYVIARHLPRFFDYSSEFVYSKIERVNDIEKIEHPLIKNAMKMLDFHEIRLSYEADLPARSGLGTSSSFAVGMLNALNILKGNVITKKALAKDAIYLERVMCNELGGWQDQITAAYGGLNRIEFQSDKFRVLPIKMTSIRKKQLNNNLLLFFTGFTRLSSEIHNHNTVSSYNKKKRLDEMYNLVIEAEEILTNENIDLNEFGRLLDHTWMLKRQTNAKVSTSLIDDFYKKGIQAGALGGKLLGAGGGGFLVFYVDPEYHENVKKAMKELLYVPFKFEDGGSQVLYYAPDNSELNG